MKDFLNKLVVRGKLKVVEPSEEIMKSYIKKSESNLASSVLLRDVFGLDESSLNNAKRERIDKQYYTGFRIAKKEVKEGIISAEDFNRDLKEFITGLNNQKIESYKDKFKELVK